MNKTLLPTPGQREDVWLRRGHDVSERHQSPDEDIDFRRWVRQYFWSVEGSTTFHTGVPGEWTLFPQLTRQVGAEHLARVFTLIAGVIEKGLVESLTTSTVVLLNRRVRDMNRRLKAVEARLAEEAPIRTVVLVDWEDVRRSAEQVGAELGWSGIWTLNPQEHRVELRVESKDIDRVSSRTFEFYRRMAQKVSSDVMQHVRFDYNIVDS
jgi:hypothetical protein